MTAPTPKPPPVRSGRRFKHPLGVMVLGQVTHTHVTFTYADPVKAEGEYVRRMTRAGWIARYGGRR